MSRHETTGPDVDAWYATDDDPWGVGSRWYERRKRQVALTALGRERYRLAWDAASGTGHLAAELTERCDALVATDAAQRAVELTRQRLSRQTDAAGSSAVSRCEAVAEPCRLPDAPASAAGADLVVLSEVLYYLPDADRAALPDLLERVTAPGPQGAPPEVLLVTWRHEPHDGFLSGEAAHSELASALAERGWHHAVHHEEDDFVLDLLTRSEPA